MALIERYHVVAAVRPVYTDEVIKEGMVVSLNSTGYVVKQSVTNPTPYGLAGDTKSTTASSMPGIASGWQNRASDYFDETKASGKMTVYHSGGEFAVDQFVAANVAGAAPMAPLYAVAGLLDTADTYSTSIVVAYLLSDGSGSQPSGVPGTDITGDIALGGDNTNTYIEIKLVI
jgi:hypothetical protein